MLFDADSEPSLKAWLTRTLEPICDADPGALSDYVLALLKHNLSEAELRRELSAQLEEFLEKGACMPLRDRVPKLTSGLVDGPPFIDSLFKALHTKSYIPYAAAEPPSSDVGIPIPLDDFLTSTSSSSIPTSPGGGRRKRSLEDDGPHPPAKGPRINNEGQFSRYGNGRGTGAWDGGRGGYPNGGMGMGNGRGSYRPQDGNRPMCRDYHIKGYCARGAMCKYSHGDEAIVPPPMIAPTSMPYIPMGTNGSFNDGYDPHNARIDMSEAGRRGQVMGPGAFYRTPRAPIIRREQNDDGSGAAVSGELPVIQDLTPQDQVLEAGEAGHQHRSRPIQPYSAPHGRVPPGHMNGAAPMGHMPGQIPMDVDMSVAAGMPHMMGPMFPGPIPFRSAMRQGTFAGPAASFSSDPSDTIHQEPHSGQAGGRPERRQDKTLVVEKIPQDKLSIESVTSWFKRFGTVTNVAIDARGGKALVSFSEHESAREAWKAEEAVFGNRFVKVFWHRPMKGHGEAGNKALAASAPLVANLNKPALTPSNSGDVPMGDATTKTAASTPVKKAPVSATASALAAKQKLLEQQIAEQKQLMQSIESASTPQEKKEIMARLRKLAEEMKTVSSTPASSTPSAKEKLEKPKLGKELEGAASPSASQAETSKEGGGGETTEDLKAQLARLKAEAASLGISDTVDVSTPPPYGSTSYRPYRGRGRGAARGYYRAASRGGPPRSLKLDNRPKKLLVKGVKEEGVQAVRDWYETTGQVDNVETLDSGDLLVSFRSRSAAEQGLAKGSHIPTVGAVQISWHAPQAPSAASRVASSMSTSTVGEASLEHVVREPSPEREPQHELEEEANRGWGDDDNEGMGMF
ncbi:hypothetical protein PUNSTDRAFT_140090 [Punctularia strigosozonata HHB-11173 SS5]|uniref:uncharacterized protein n=1 Tax=Punctularia strigosozonata (strain HHB-11173) TaxID=741275 RepID=UPI000441735C|nr:uncharacterized protein PUNSTDRAFT_140090 [Punctularia strigosozonata HHB-11173 SS5]EIN13581.1 hypothetical protein PUNSTDRAFT_140090 [Punctularia strigosozonata HHB-11173 SS5]